MHRRHIARDPHAGEIGTLADYFPLAPGRPGIDASMVSGKSGVQSWRS
jgi:hypothetical protein